MTANCKMLRTLQLVIIFEISFIPTVLAVFALKTRSAHTSIFLTRKTGQTSCVVLALLLVLSAMILNQSKEKIVSLFLLIFAKIWELHFAIAGKNYTRRFNFTAFPLL